MACLVGRGGGIICKGQMGSIKGTVSIIIGGGDKLNTKKLVVVLECLKNRAFHSADCLRSFIIMPFTKSVVEC